MNIIETELNVKLDSGVKTSFKINNVLFSRSIAHLTMRRLALPWLITNCQVIPRRYPNFPQVSSCITLFLFYKNKVYKNVQVRMVKYNQELL